MIVNFIGYRFVTPRPNLTFHYDNGRSHTSLKAQEKLRKLDWDVLPHPSYPSDIALSDYYLFRSLEHRFRGENFESEEDLKTGLLQFFDQKDQKILKNGILNLIERWKDVVGTNGKYVAD